MKLNDYKIINRRKRNLVWIADKLADAAAHFGLIPRSEPSVPFDKKTINNILIVRLAYIGDVVMTMPVIKPLAEAFPGAAIDFLTSRAAAPLLVNHPHLRNVVEFDAPWFYSKQNGSDGTVAIVRKLKASHYNLGIDFRGDIRNIFHCLYQPGIRFRLSYTSGGGGALLTHPVAWERLQHKVEYHLDLLRKTGIPAARTNPGIYFTGSELDQARNMLDSIPGCRQKTPVMVHPGARLPLKKWPATHFADVIRKIQENDLGPVILLGAPGSGMGHDISERAPVSADLTGVLSIRQMAALMSLGRMVICHDSGPMHIAAAAGAKVIALFGPSRPIETAPSGEGHSIIEAPCELKDDCDENTCRRSPEGCMAKIPVDAVYRQVKRLSKISVDKNR
jgi:ADP-heptose:LPS heptosyltransferase